MGLDNFMGGDSDETTTEKQENQTNNEKSGIAAFMTTDSFDTESENEPDVRETVVPWIHDLSPNEWNSMSTLEKVEYVREEYEPAYRPEINIENPVDYRIKAHVTCECGVSLVFKRATTCPTCKRAYRRKKEDVVLVHNGKTR